MLLFLFCLIISTIYWIDCFVFQAKGDNGLDIDGAISTPISTDSSSTEYELTGLKPNTNYVVIIKLYNEVGVAEQKFRIKTNQESNGKKENIILLKTTQFTSISCTDQTFLLDNKEPYFHHDMLA